MLEMRRRVFSNAILENYRRKEELPHHKLHFGKISTLYHDKNTSTQKTIRKVNQYWKQTISTGAVDNVHNEESVKEMCTHIYMYMYIYL